MYYFIVNPNADCGWGEYVWKKTKAQLEAGGVEYEAYLTEVPGDARAYAEALTKGRRDPIIIAVVGGDGTMNEVLDGLNFGGPVTLGYIPAGAGNDLARSLKLPRRPSRCLRKILHPKYHRLLDYGVATYGDDAAHHKRFMISSGIGLDAAVCHEILYTKLRRGLRRVGLGRFCYLLLGLWQLLAARPVKGYILMDGDRKVEFNYIYQVSAHIHPYKAGGYKFAPGADCSDGHLTVCVISQSDKRKVASLLLGTFLRGGRKCRGVRTFECRECKIVTERPLAVHVDGESCQHRTSLELRCIEKKIRMIV